ncbi:WYL domain-containing protein [Clostridium sp. E02]|uniref:helix-turn-helix transcriptional regulator n=1 Tax=Clostridium sp. E02 TaxID=2487134 RepID=UPI000F52E0DB|nr:WYL domain-containing protein [Clostridium sp. E02]
MQINRLFEMVYLLLNKKNVTAGEMAKHFEVSPRTIYRDVELLSSAGIPIYMTKGKGGGISLLPDFVLNKTYLYGYCRERNDYRFFKLRRIKNLMVTEEQFERNKPEKIFNGSQVFEDDFVTIALKFSNEMAYRVYDEFTFGEHCEVLEPIDIRLQIKEKLQRTLQQYL